MRARYIVTIRQDGSRCEIRGGQVARGIVSRTSNFVDVTRINAYESMRERNKR